MDKSIAILIPILVVSIPVIAIIFSGMQKLAKLRLEEMRLRGGSASQPELENLRSDVEQLRQELGEVQERLDFTERMLAQKDKARLGQDPDGQ